MDNCLNKSTIFAGFTCWSFILTITINTKAYNADAAISANAVPYNGPAQSLSVKDRLELARVAPKKTSAFSGTGRARAKLTRTQALTGALTTTGDSIFDVSTSVPVGTPDADVDTMCNDVAAFIGSATFKTLVKKQLLSY